VKSYMDTLREEFLTQTIQKIQHSGNFRRKLRIRLPVAEGRPLETMRDLANPSNDMKTYNHEDCRRRKAGISSPATSSPAVWRTDARGCSGRGSCIVGSACTGAAGSVTIVGGLYRRRNAPACLASSLAQFRILHLQN
jgi:hypothetical protein